MLRPGFAHRVRETAMCENSHMALLPGSEYYMYVWYNSFTYKEHLSGRSVRSTLYVDKLMVRE